MENETIKELIEQVEGWLNFNKNRKKLDLLDLSKLITIFKQYYTMREKNE